MNRILKLLTLFLVLIMLVQSSVISVFALSPIEVDTGIYQASAPRYNDASDVNYVTAGGYVVNWGLRGETATFLSKYAQSFYKSGDTYEEVSKLSGNSNTSSTPSSALYKELQSIMKSAHKKQTSYGDTKNLYKYTDCINNDYAHISSFYSGKELTGNWDGAATWNREHTWPNSKGLGGNDENDIMMLRPTWVQENSSRGNTAYGQSSGYYDPNDEANGKYNLRGDVARICLYVYVRWGNTSYMWGKSGVMESMPVLLQWMEEDPVDTWEMGRNDAVQSITGTRNVFVDYPEYAFLLFGKEIPSDMPTPSGEASNGGCDHNWTSATCTTPKTCTICGATSGSSLGHSWDNGKVTTAETCTTTGEKLFTCSKCGSTQTTVIAALGHKWGDWVTDVPATETTTGTKHRECTVCHNIENGIIPEIGHDHVYTTTVVTAPTCTAQGYTTHTCECGESYVDSYTAVKSHTYVNGLCSVCGEAAPVNPLGTKEDFYDIIRALKLGLVSGEAEYQMICDAISLYNSLSKSDKEALSEQYASLIKCVSDYNTEIATFNNDSNAINPLSIALAVTASVLPFAALMLLKKKEF